jgi:hypothetical protein
MTNIQRTGMDVSRMQPSQVLALQRTIGNRAVQNLISSQSTPTIQTKLQVGPVGDHYEQEADRIANQVVNTSTTTLQPVQRTEGAEAEEEELQMKRQENTIQRFSDEDEDELDEVEEEEEYQPTGKELRKEMGLGKVIGWNLAIRGAKMGDWAMNRFRSNRRTPLTNRATTGAVDTAVNARNRLYRKNQLKNLSKSERRQILREDREYSRQLHKNYKDEERPGMINI